MLCIILKLHGYCCITTAVYWLFFCFCLPVFLFFYASDDSLCFSRSCLASFRFPAVSACVCVSRSFSALFLRLPHRGCNGIFLPNRPNTTASCSVVCSIYTAIFCLSMFLGLLPTKCRVAFSSRSCNLTPLFMGAGSCEKSESLQTFYATFLMNALYGSKKLRKKFGNFHFRQ